MRAGRVVGTIWATRRHPSTEGLTLQWVLPESVSGKAVGSPIVAVDTVGAGPGERVFYVTAREAVIAIDPQAEAPIDASIVGIIENFEDCSEEVQ